MNIGQIRYFVSVYQAGSFSQAAKSQFITVQAVSKSIADLEHEIGHELFERRSRGVEPTAYGAVFYQKAVNALGSFDELQTFALGQTGDQVSSSLTLGLCAPRFKNSAHVCASVGSLIGNLVNAPVEVRLTSGYEGLAQLRKGDVDALITIGSLDTLHTDCVPVLSTPTAVSMVGTHPLASQGAVSLEQLADYPVIVDSDLDFFNESILRHLRASRPGLGALPSPLARGRVGALSGTAGLCVQRGAGGACRRSLWKRHRSHRPEGRRRGADLPGHRQEPENAPVP